MNSLVDLDGRGIADALEANRELLVRQNMLEKGQAYETASRDLSTLISLLRALGDVSLRAGASNGRMTLDLVVDPGPAPGKAATLPGRSKK